jgi:hypothetical protein
VLHRHVPLEREKKLGVSQSVQTVLEVHYRQPVRTDPQVTQVSVPLSAYPVSHGHLSTARVLNDPLTQLVQLVPTVLHSSHV